MKHYCIQSGCEIIYSGLRPNFCNICGAPQNATAAKKTSSPVAQSSDDEDEFEGELKEYDVESLSSMIQMNVSDNPGGVKLKSVLGTPGEEFERRKGMTKKQFQETIQWVKAKTRIDGDKD